MRKIVILLGILVLAGLVAGCAAPLLPRVYQDVSRLAAKKIFVKDVQVFKNAEAKNENLPREEYYRYENINFIDQTDEADNVALGKLLKDTMEDELRKNGFIVADKLWEIDNETLVLEMKMINVFPPVPLFTNGYYTIGYAVFLEKEVVMTYAGSTFTESLFNTARYKIKERRVGVKDFVEILNQAFLK